MGRLRPDFLTSHGFAADVLVETGSQSGLSAERCAPLFATVHTIELSRRWHRRASRKLARFPHVYCHQGDSPVILPRVIDPARATLFWLDAHYTGRGEPPPGVPQCPVLAELRAIFAAPWRTPPTILIDDARMFYRNFWETERAAAFNRRQWPGIRAIERLARQRGYHVERLGDVLAVTRDASLPCLETMFALCRAIHVDGVVQVGVGYADELRELLPAIGRPPLIGFEPAPAVLKHWEQAAADGRGYPGELIPAAVSDQAGMVTIYSSKGRRESSSLFPRGKGEPAPVAVPAVTLDGFLGERINDNVSLGQRLLLWIDCEGAELLALRGGRRFLERCAVVVCECHEAHERSRPRELSRVGVPARKEVLAELEAAGFERRFEIEMVGEVFTRRSAVLD